MFFNVITIKDNVVTGGEIDIQKLTCFHSVDDCRWSLF